MRSQIWIMAGALSGFISVAAGAFAAHGLRPRLSPEMLAIFETGARYQMYHALLLVLVGVLAGRQGPGSAPLSWAGLLLVAGTVLFSGSLYVLSLSGQRWLGAITPVGGLCFLAGWVALGYAALRSLSLS